MTISAIICAAIALVLLGMYPVAEHRAIELNGAVTVWVGALRSGSGLLFIVLPLLATGLLAVTVMIHGLGAGWAGEPRRSAPRLIKLLPSLATGVVVGLRSACCGRPTRGTRAGGITSLAFNPNASTLVSAGDDGVIRLWNVAMLGRQQPR